MGEGSLISLLLLALRCHAQFEIFAEGIYAL